MKRGKAETEFSGSFVGLAFETRLNRAFGKFLDSLGDVLCIDPGSVVQKGEKHVTRAFGVEDAVFDVQKMIVPEVKTTPIGEIRKQEFLQYRDTVQDILVGLVAADDQALDIITDVRFPHLNDVLIVLVALQESGIYEGLLTVPL